MTPSCAVGVRSLSIPFAQKWLKSSYETLVNRSAKRAMVRRLCENIREESPVTNGILPQPNLAATISIAMRGFYLTAATPSTAAATALTAPALPAVVSAATASTAPTTATATTSFRINIHLFTPFPRNHSFLGTG
jgi:hypothetical protein